MDPDVLPDMLCILFVYIFYIWNAVHHAAAGVSLDLSVFQQRGKSVLWLKFGNFKGMFILSNILALT